MRKKESWFSVAIHPAFLIENELEKAQRNSKKAKEAKAAAASLQLGLFPKLESKTPAEPAITESAITEPEAPESTSSETGARTYGGSDAAHLRNIMRIDALTKPEIDPIVPAEVPAHTRTVGTERTFGRINDSSKPQIDPQIDPVVPAEVPAHTRTERTFGRINDSSKPQIHPDDKIWPTGDSPSLVDRIRDSASAAGGHLQNLKDRLSRVFGSSPAAEEETKASIPPSIEPSREERIDALRKLRESSPERIDALKKLRESSPERIDALRKLRESYRERAPGQQAATPLPDAQELVQNLANATPVGQVRQRPIPLITNPEITAKLREKRVLDRPLSEIRTLREANAHRDRIKQMIKNLEYTQEHAKAYGNAVSHADGHEAFENAHQTPLLHGDLGIYTIGDPSLSNGIKDYNPHTSWGPSEYAVPLMHMGNAMRQKIEDAGGIHKAMENTQLADKIRLVHEAEEHMRENFPDLYGVMSSDDHKGDVLERPLEGIRNSKDAWDHVQKIGERSRDESDKFDETSDGSEAEEAQRLILHKVDETFARATAHWSALFTYRRHPKTFIGRLKDFDPENMREEDKEKYQIHMNAANTVLQQKIAAAGGKDYARYDPKIVAIQDHIRQIASAHQAPNPQAAEEETKASISTPISPSIEISHQERIDAQRKFGESYRERAEERQEAEEKRQEEIRKEQEHQRHRQELMDSLSPSVGSVARRR